jgi:hypothetical protein
MKKIVMLIIAILMITGCSVKYKIVINEDLTLTEDANLTGTSYFFSNYYKTTKTNVLKSFIDIYKDILDENNYKYEIVDDLTPYVHVTKKYDSVSDYVNNSKLFNGYFDEVKYTEDGNIKRIETIGYNDNNPNDPDRFNVKELKITIQCAYKVTNHNAKEVDKKTNTYRYELNEDNDKIILEYDTSKKYDPNSELVTTLIILFAIVIGAWVSIFVLNKNKNS